MGGQKAFDKSTSVACSDGPLETFSLSGCRQFVDVKKKSPKPENGRIYFSEVVFKMGFFVKK